MSKNTLSSSELTLLIKEFKIYKSEVNVQNLRLEKRILSSSGNTKASLITSLTMCDTIDRCIYTIKKLPLEPIILPDILMFKDFTLTLKNNKESKSTGPRNIKSSGYLNCNILEDKSQSIVIPEVINEESVINYIMNYMYSLDEFPEKLGEVYFQIAVVTVFARFHTLRKTPGDAPFYC